MWVRESQFSIKSNVKKMWLGKNKKIKTLNTEFWLKNRFGQKKKKKKKH